MTKKINIGVILAAGSGERMGHLGKILPKVLLPIGPKLILEHILLHFKKIGAKKVFLVVGYKGNLIKRYLKENLPLLKIKILENKNWQRTNIADSIYLTKKYIKEPFMVILGDDYSKTPPFLNLIKIFFKKNAEILQAVVEEKDKKILRSTCCLKLDKNQRVLEIQEKPQNPCSSLRGCGIYLFKPSIYNFIEKTPSNLKRWGITGTIKFALKTEKVYGEYLEGVNININTIDDLLLANYEKRSF